MLQIRLVLNSDIASRRWTSNLLHRCCNIPSHAYSCSWWKPHWLCPGHSRRTSPSKIWQDKERNELRPRFVLIIQLKCMYKKQCSLVINHTFKKLDLFKCVNANVWVKKTTCKIMQECITARSNIHLILNDDEIRSLCGALAVFRQKYHSIITINV